MKMIITGRHFDVTEDLSQYAEKKLAKLEKYFHKLIDIEVIMYIEKHNHIIEAVINGDGMKFYGTEKASDMYSSVDLLVKSLEKQVVKHKEKHSGHKVQPLTKNIQPDLISEDRIDVVITQAGNKPKNEVEAFLEMKVENRDYILFKKNIEHLNNNNNCYSVIYQTENGFRMAEIPHKIVKEKGFDAKKLKEFELIIRNDSLTNPKIKIKKCRKKTIKCMEMDNAITELMTSGKNFVPYFNSETNSFNIIYNNGESIEVMVPPV